MKIKDNLSRYRNSSNKINNMINKVDLINLEVVIHQLSWQLKKTMRNCNIKIIYNNKK